MASADNLIKRLNTEFAAHREKASQFRADSVQAYKDQVQRLDRLEANFAQLSKIWKPRLDVLIAQFDGAVKVSPKVASGNRQAVFAFQSPVANISLRLAASSNTDITKVVMTYDLDILPIFISFEKHSQIEFPLDKIDEDAAGQWLDDRIVDFIKTYLSISENEYYLKDHLVVDPVSHTQFPKFVAEATLQRDGKTYYFISQETYREFEGRKA